MSNNFDEPTNQFEAYAWLAKDRTIKGVGPRAVAFTLLAFWNLNGEGKSFPSRARLMEILDIKSKDTLRSYLDELVMGGHFAEVPEPGRNTVYYPMMVKGANKKLLAKSQQAVRDRLARKSTTKKTSAPSRTADSPIEQTPSADDAKEENAGHRFGSWIKTDSDRAIASEYDAFLEEVRQNPSDWDPVGLPVVTVVSDVVTTGLPDMSSTPKCVVAGSVPVPTDVLPSRWVDTWGGNYGNTFSLSQIADLYTDLLAKTFSDNLPYSTVHEVDVAMHVLGQDGFPPTRNVVNALRYAPVLDDRMSKLRVDYQETLRARSFCYEHIMRGNYDHASDNL